MSLDDEALFILKMPPDFPVDDLYAVAEILFDADIFIPGYIPPEVGLYEPKGFLYSHHAERLETILLPDRNVASRLAQVIRGKSVSQDHQRRQAAAIMAFAQCLDIQIEPSIAFHELAHVQGNDAAHEELAWFRAADHPRPLDWLNVALSRADRMNIQAPPPSVVSRNLARPLHRWKRNYIHALKIGEIELTPMSKLDQVLTFFKWMYEGFMLGGPAALLAAIYFAPNSAPRGGLFKSLRSPDRERAIGGIRNAAWDLTHLSDFTRHVQDQSKRYLFASFDVGARHVAGLLFETGQDPKNPETVVTGLRRWWPEKDARLIAQMLFDYFSRGRPPEWYADQAANPGRIDELVSEGERAVRQFAVA
ncbi:hypothetical protein SAMN05216570_2557 [Dyella sp. OK004]|uniref:hypothetical protein n=1 Tax=Dyella sp. OK004 TaxID=1855292 RepID=UPI0008E8D0C6|nr:hypothetical protein [Dyella sp. OK004]SFS11709.1 hypothetical protein SAMN05216570_2557 [Dyella sp. OK004]